MGGGYYDREVETTYSAPISMAPASAAGGTSVAASRSRPRGPVASQASQKALSQSSLHADLNPKGKTLTANAAHPVIVCFDVTGSMGDWPRVVYDKMPMFYGQMMMNAYLPDPALAFMAVGDTRNCPLQVTDFASGNELDTEMKKIWLSRKGLGSPEHYEMAAWFLARHTDFKQADIKPFLFLIGDAEYFATITPTDMKAHLGDSVTSPVMSRELWTEVMEKCNMYYFHKRYTRKRSKSPNARILDHKEKTQTPDQNSLHQWRETVGQDRIMNLDNAKACVDAMLGVIALVSDSHTLEAYMEDMVERGQDATRCRQVRACLQGCMSAIEADKAQANILDDDLA